MKSKDGCYFCIVLLPEEQTDPTASKLEGLRDCPKKSCNAPARMLVPEKRHDEVAAMAKSEVEKKWKVGAPTADDAALGPLANAKQFEKVQRLIQKGIEEGAKVVTGGIGRPEGFNKGYFVRPTVFANVRTDMTIAREEIFGPVITVMPYKDEAEAVRIANDTLYGLSSQVHSGDPARAHRVANKIRTGMVHLNGAPLDFSAPFGGYKQSGNGREWGRFGLEEFLEVKAVMGHKPAPAH